MLCSPNPGQRDAVTQLKARACPWVHGSLYSKHAHTPTTRTDGGWWGGVGGWKKQTDGWMIEGGDMDGLGGGVGWMDGRHGGMDDRGWRYGRVGWRSRLVGWMEGGVWRMDA